MGASVNLKNAAGGLFLYTPQGGIFLYNKRLELEQQGGVVCMKANMCGTPLRRATLSLAGSARFRREYKASTNRSTQVAQLEELGRRFYGR